MDLTAPKTAHSRWADDPVLDVTLRELFDKGLTFSQIAAGLWKFGHKFTRNAIIGRAHRLHFPAREPSGGKVKSPEHKQKLTESRRRLALERAWTPAADVSPTASAAGPFLGLSLLELAATDCRYPHGDGPDIRFCGQPAQEDSSYCPTHHAICCVRNNRS